MATKSKKKASSKKSTVKRTVTTASKEASMKKTTAKAKQQNHVGNTKDHAITCKGVIGDLSGAKLKEAEALYGKSLKGVTAKNHTKIRLVHKQDAFQVTRCEACQKMFQSILRKKNAAKRSEGRKFKKLQEQATQAQQSIRAIQQEAGSVPTIDVEGYINNELVGGIELQFPAQEDEGPRKIYLPIVMRN